VDEDGYVIMIMMTVTVMIKNKNYMRFEVATALTVGCDACCLVGRGPLLWRNMLLPNSDICMISGFHHDVDDICALVGYYAASSGNSLELSLDATSRRSQISY